MVTLFLLPTTLLILSKPYLSHTIITKIHGHHRRIRRCTSQRRRRLRWRSIWTTIKTPISNNLILWRFRITIIRTTYRRCFTLHLRIYRRETASPASSSVVSCEEDVVWALKHWFGIFFFIYQIVDKQMVLTHFLFFLSTHFLFILSLFSYYNHKGMILTEDSSKLWD